MQKEIRFAPMLPTHWPRVREIYQIGIETKLATFRLAAPAWEEFDSGHLPSCRLLALAGSEIAGWAALSPAFAGRPFYRGVVEESIYIDPAFGGRGIGGALLRALLAACDEAGFWTVEARIIRENEVSLALHRACGFREVGYRERLGQMADTGRWHDVVFLEYRSKRNGTD